MLKRLFLTLIVLIVSVSSKASDIYNLEGTLGKSKIYMRFEDFTDDYPNEETNIYDVRYFYANSLKDIVLEGSRIGSTFTFYFDYDQGKFKEKFILRHSDNGKFTGTWQDGKGKQLNVILMPIELKIVSNPYSQLKLIQDYKRTNPFEYVRSSKLKFKTDSIMLFQGNAFRWVSEVHSAAFGFYLDSTVSQETLVNVNSKLEEILVGNSMDQLTCSSQWDYSSGNGIEQSITINFLDTNLLSFTVFDSWFCGGAHPDFGKSCYLLDLKSGKNYEFEELFSFDSSSVVYDEKKENFDQFSEYRTNYFAHHLVSMLVDQELIPEDYVGDDEPCIELYRQEDSWIFPDWEYTSEGIVFTPSVFRAARACETETFLLPYQVLEKWKVNTFPYNFPTR